MIYLQLNIARRPNPYGLSVRYGQNQSRIKNPSYRVCLDWSYWETGSGRSNPSPMWWAFCMKKMNQSKSKHLHLGRIGELLMKAEFIKSGFDVFSTEVDDKGIDFILRNEEGKHFDIQVKATNQKYVFMRKEVFIPSINLYVALLILNKRGEQFFVLIPSLDFIKEDKPIFLVDRNFEGKKSPPEYGIYTSDKYLEKIRETYQFSKIVKELR